MIPPPKRQLLRQRPKTTPEPRRPFLPIIPPGIDPRKHPALWHLLPEPPEPSADPEDAMRLALEAWG